MAAKLDTQTLGLVFQGRPDILVGIEKAANNAFSITLFNNIAAHIHHQLSNGASEDGPTAKRRRVDIAPQSNGFSASQNGAPSSQIGVSVESDPVLLEIKDISVSVPQRKKYDLCFTKNYLYARASGASVQAQGIVYPWRTIEHAFYLPVPDKSQAQHNYILFPQGSYLPTSKAQGPTTDLEPLVFTVPATAPKPGSIAGPSAATAEPVSDSYTALFNWALTTSLRAAGNTRCQLVASDPKLFHSVARQAYRPNEKAVHVKAFRGSKDGFLFFLPTGILWGFKKPLIFLPLDRIVALSYTSVLQRTFNIVVEYEKDEGTEEIEFGMLDQEDYQGINENYVHRYGLADRSMAEQRKAKRELVENGKKKEGAAGEEENKEEGDGLTELERAQREAEQALQDDEDEDEEDYDPGSEGESEGSGTSDEEDDDDDGEGEGYDEEEDEEGDMAVE
ncbi:hypothetical protein OQA88_8034 [Cercophora sp. LCS_1]